MIKDWKQARKNAAARRAARRGAPRRHKSGFSLMEMLIVLAIMGVLVALVGPRLVAALSGAQSKAAKADIRSIQTALETMSVDIGRYPTQQEGLSLLQQNPNAGVANWNGPYLRNLPNDPWGKPYIYTVPADGGEPKVGTLGKDGQPNGTGADADVTS